MYLNPKTAIKEGWVKFPEWMDEEFRLKCIQPNAIDITLDRLFALNPHSNFVLSEDDKRMRESYEIKPISSYSYVVKEDGIKLLESSFAIPPGVSDVMSDFRVTVPEGVAAFIIVRSTLNRNGLFITSGLYDSGYNGNAGFALHNRGPVAHIAPHTRVAQLVFVKSEDSGILYAGGYNHDEGTHWSELGSEEVIEEVIEQEVVEEVTIVEDVQQPELVKITPRTNPKTKSKK